MPKSEAKNIMPKLKLIDSQIILDNTIINNITVALTNSGEASLRTGSRRTESEARQILEEVSKRSDIELVITKHEGRLAARVI